MKNILLLSLAVITILLVTLTPTTAAIGTLTITNLSPETYNFSQQQLNEMPKTTEYAELYCYGSLVTFGDWGGIQLSYLLAQTNATSEVQSIQFTASDGYRVVIPIDLALQEGTIIAFELDGSPLSGLRLVLPGLNGDAWIDQIVSINMSTNIVNGPSSASATLPGGISSNVPGIVNKTLTQTTKASPTPTPTPNQPTPVPTPTPTAPPANNQEPPQPSPQQQNNQNQALNVDGTTVLVAAVSVVGLGIAAVLVFKRKNARLAN